MSVGIGPPRIVEIDALRGVAIIMMVTFHVLWDLNYFGLLHVDLYSGPQALFAYSIGTLFLFLVGISLTLSYSRARSSVTGTALPLKYVERGLRLLALGGIISLVTLFFVGEGFVVFGVISCIGVSIVLSYPFLKRPHAALLVGLILVPLGVLLSQFTFPTYWLLWLGLVPDGFNSIDYFPLLPWFGIVLLGIATGTHFYGRMSAWKQPSESRAANPLAFMGRHSLLIYLVHQPIILAILLFLIQL